MSRNGQSHITAPELPNVQVVNRHTFTGPRDESYFYVGRGTALGNNWSHIPNTAAQFRVSSLQEAVGNYRQWLWQEIQRGTGPAFTALQQLKERAVAGEKVSLACSCKPQLCHGDVIKGAIEHLAQRDRDQALRQTQTVTQSQTVFVSGSRSLKTLPAAARDRLDEHITKGAHMLVGDAPGIDTLVQQYLATRDYRNVTVCHIGAAPRNNLGFEPHRVDGNRQTDKDRYMAEQADRGLAIWDGKSPGTKTNIARLETDVVKVSARASLRGEAARADIVAKNSSDNFRALYTVPEGLTRGQHTTTLHHRDQFARADFEHGATVSDAVLSIPRDPDSRSTDGANVRIGTESHAIDFVSRFISDPAEAQAKGERLHQLVQQACGQWTDTHGRWEIADRIYDLVRKDENGQYRTADEKAVVIDQVLDSIEHWAGQLPEPTPEPTAEEVHQFTLELAEENRHTIHEPQVEETIDVRPSDSHLLYLHELQSNSHGLATIAELSGFSFDTPAAEQIVDESQVYGELFENAVVDAMDFSVPEGDHLGAERIAGEGPMLDATFDRVNLERLPPTLPDNLSEQTETYLLDTLLPTIDAQIEHGLSRHQILSAIYEANRTNETQRFNEMVGRAFGIEPNARGERQAPSRDDQLSALTSLRLLVAGEYKRETRGFTREAIEWAKANYRLNPDQLRAAGKLRVSSPEIGPTFSDYQKLVHDQTDARAEWIRSHPGQQAPYRAQIERINQLETAGHKINNRITALEPSRAELSKALNDARGSLLSAQEQTEARLNAFERTEERMRDLAVQARDHAQAVRESDSFAGQHRHFVHDEHERAIDERQSLNRSNNARFDYLTQDSHSDRGNSANEQSAVAQTKQENELESRTQREQLINALTDRGLEHARHTVNEELQEHQRYFNQIAGREVATAAEARDAVQSSLSSLGSMLNYAEVSQQRLDPNAPAPDNFDVERSPLYISLASNEQLRLPVVSLSQYDAIQAAVGECRLETTIWRGLHSPAPITGRDEERDAVASFVGQYIDFRATDYVTAELNHNSVFREYALRLSDARTNEELVEVAVAISKENFEHYRQAEAHRANPTVAPPPEKPPLSLNEMRQVFLSVTPTTSVQAARAQMRDVLLSTVFGKEKTARVQLLNEGKLHPSPTLSKLLDNLNGRSTIAAVNHFYASLRNPTPDRQNIFNLYEAHRSLPQYERDYLYQYALAAKYESLKDRGTKTPAQAQTLPLDAQTQTPASAIAAKETQAYRSYYGQADWREATLCAEAASLQSGIGRAALERGTITPEFSDLEVRTIAYAVSNFDHNRQTQIADHLRGSDDLHQQTLGDLLSLSAEAHLAGGHEINVADIHLPENYSVSPEAAAAVITYALQDQQQSLSPDKTAELRQAAQRETWNELQSTLVPDPSLLVDASPTALAEARDLHRAVQSAANLQERARTAFAVRDSHVRSCVEKATAALRDAHTEAADNRLSFNDALPEQTINELVKLALSPGRADIKGLVNEHRPQFEIIQNSLSQTDIERSAQLHTYAASARDEYLQTFVQIETAQAAVQQTQTELAQKLSAEYEQVDKQLAGASDRYAAVQSAVERTLLGDRVSEMLAANQELNASDEHSQSVRDLLPADVLAQVADEAREQAWQSFEPQELRDREAGHAIDERPLNLAYTVMDRVDTARTIQQASIEAEQRLNEFIDQKTAEREAALREVSAAPQPAPDDRAERDPSDGLDVSRIPVEANQAKTQNVNEQTLTASLIDRESARAQTISELKGQDARRYETFKSNVELEQSKLAEAFQQIDNTFDQLAITRTEVRVEQQMSQYQQIATPVAERVNDYLKDATREEGLKALLEPLRHEDHVERIALMILETAATHHVQLDTSVNGLTQVHDIAANLFDTVRDGMERANQHLLQGRELTAELHRPEFSQHQSVPALDPSAGNGHGHMPTNALDRTVAISHERILDLTRNTHDLLKDNPFAIEHDPTQSTNDLAQSITSTNSGPQTLTPNQPDAQQIEAPELELVL
jgi:Domain of unknown function (DUF4326)